MRLIFNKINIITEFTGSWLMMHYFNNLLQEEISSSIAIDSVLDDTNGKKSLMIIPLPITSDTRAHYDMLDKDAPDIEKLRINVKVA